MGGKMNLSDDFKEFLQSLNDNDAHYLIVGGYAVAIHGHPRYTKDIDIWIESAAQNAARMVSALDDFGFGSLGLQAEDFLVPGQIIQLGYPPNRIDIITSLEGLDFGECYQKRMEIEIGGVKAKFIDLANLKKSKQLAGRHQDLADLENLE